MKLTDRARLLWGLVRLGLRASPESPTTNLSDPDTWLVDWMTGGGQSASGISVSSTTAMQIVAFYAAVRILAESVASLPIHLYERMSNNDREPARQHPVSHVLKVEPNELMSPFIYRETMQGHVASRGNAYSLIDRDGNGDVRALWPIPPDMIEPRVYDKSGALYYQLNRELNGRKILLPREVLHVPGLGYDGLKGYNPVALCREALGLAMATEKSGASLFGQGSRPSGILTTDKTLSDEQKKQVAAGWKAAHEGPSNLGKTALLDGNLQWKQITISPEDAQFLETRKFQVSEIARMFRIPPHMLGDLERATFSNIEHQSIEFVVHTLRPWLVRWEGEINRKLLLPSERDRFYAEFSVEGLLRGDTKARYDGYQKAILTGWLNRNEARRLENLPPGPPELDEYLEPQNMAVAGDDDGDGGEEQVAA